MMRRMMYRVFLQDERDAPKPLPSSSDFYRIRSGELVAGKNGYPLDYLLSLEEQLRSLVHEGFSVGPSIGQVNRHWLITCDDVVVGVVHRRDEIPGKAYTIARKTAINAAQTLSRIQGVPYVFIDVTSRGNLEFARRLSLKVQDVEISEEPA